MVKSIKDHIRMVRGKDLVGSSMSMVTNSMDSLIRMKLRASASKFTTTIEYPSVSSLTQKSMGIVSIMKTLIKNKKGSD